MVNPIKSALLVMSRDLNPDLQGSSTLQALLYVCFATHMCGKVLGACGLTVALPVLGR